MMVRDVNELTSCVRNNYVAKLIRSSSAARQRSGEIEFRHNVLTQVKQKEEEMESSKRALEVSGGKPS